MEDDEVEWVTPEGYLATYHELDEVSIQLDAFYGEEHDPVNFMFIGEVIPQFLEIDNDTKRIVGQLDFLENWYPGYQKPVPYIIDTDETAFGNYGNYGIYLYGPTDAHFIVRAYAEGYDPESEDPQNELFYKDREFWITVEPDYSSLRDRTIYQYFDEDNIAERGELKVDGVPYTPEQWILYWKSQGYYT